MAKNRYINTKFWDDNYITELDPIEKLMFLYFLTNSLTDICGIYEIPLKRIAFDTGIDKEMILKIVKRFSDDDKIYYIDGWIYIKNFLKHQANNPSIEKGIERSIGVIPKEIINNIKEIAKDDTGSDRLYTGSDLPKPKPKYNNKEKKTNKTFKDGDTLTLNDGLRVKRYFGNWVVADNKNVRVDERFYPELK